MNEDEQLSKKKKARKALPRTKAIKNTEEAKKATGGKDFEGCPTTSKTHTTWLNLPTKADC
ncbi:MAG: hypothetical protein K2X77_17200 [Candidatus Obscuribacterales bacterium]|nr:hypothetical protein [Candidatus Obscuribacterales bacterium]